MPAIMFHHFRQPDEAAPQGAITADELHQLLDSCGPILGAEEWTYRAARGELHNRDVCLTFDDGLRCQYDIALPVLQERGITAFWFVYSEPLKGVGGDLEIHRYFRCRAFPTQDDFYAAFFKATENLHMSAMPDNYLKDFPFYSLNDKLFRYIRDEVLGPLRYQEVLDAMMEAAAFSRPSDLWLTESQVTALHSLGHVIGLHSHSHPTRLAALPAEQQAREYRLNSDHLASLIGVAPTVMSHPSNSYSSETLGILRNLGVSMGFRSNMAQHNGSLLELPRVDHSVLMAAL